MTQQIMSFQAEVKQLLHLMIHSLYSNKEIFLRELISNASDAGDRLRFEALANSSLYENDPNIRIRITHDKVARVIEIDDNGIGMSLDEVVSNLGTIARSGTKEFISKLSVDQKKDAGLIGQFGVGFYSGFIVADRIIVETRRAGLLKSEGVRWESTAEKGEFTVDKIDREKRGTLITLYLREGEDELLSTHRLKSIIQKYSDHISLPILMKKEEWDQKKGEMIEIAEDEIVNQASALWSRSKSDITEEQYKQFYQHITHDHNDPLAWTHNQVEGRIEYTQLLYVPSSAPFDMWNSDYKGGLKLYVKRIFIMDDAENLLPRYLRFIRGVIDLSDMPLNISREILQQSSDVKIIREGITKRVLSMLEDLAFSADTTDRNNKFLMFWRAFGQVIKEGIGEDDLNRDRLIKLLRFSTSYSETDIQDVSLTDYVARMKAGQTKIYYITADGWKAAANSPHLEVFRKKGIEVILLTDRVDEWMLSFLSEFDGKSFSSVARGCLDLSELSDDIKNIQHVDNETQEVIDRIKKVLGDKVKDVRPTFRLTDSPSCLVSDDRDMSGYLQRMLKASGQKPPLLKPILEINPEHALVKKLKVDDTNFSDWCYLLFDQALLAEGGILDDPACFVKRSNALLLSEYAK
ncbi:MAG: molecular chaperone HtpG [Burkholderia sp.]|nr:molecular chaperone HtpG [Burkholderia sp.]